MGAWLSTDLCTPASTYTSSTNGTGHGKLITDVYMTERHLKAERT